jgi:hypothetical protein
MLFACVFLIGFLFRNALARSNDSHGHQKRKRERFDGGMET